MKLCVELHNAGGVLDSRTVENGHDDEEVIGGAAKAALLEMLQDLPFLADGDKIVVRAVQ
ncbi:MAG TPA: hypothetical protein VGF29_15850 [Hyphomicrobiaceae bacterium]|jgi:hypothetical protein